MITGIVSDEFHLSPAEFEHAVRRAREEFEAVGIGDGDTVALLLRNDVSFLVAMTALGRSGIYAATLNWQSHSDEVAYVLNDCGARAVLVEDGLIERFAAAIPASVTVYAVGPNGGAPRTETTAFKPLPLLDWNRRVSEHSSAEKELRSAKGVIVYTSGTTGKPKGVRRQPFPDKAAEAKLRFDAGPGVRHPTKRPNDHLCSALSQRPVRLCEAGGQASRRRRSDRPAPQVRC